MSQVYYKPVELIVEVQNELYKENKLFIDATISNIKINGIDLKLNNLYLKIITDISKKNKTNYQFTNNKIKFITTLKPRTNFHNFVDSNFLNNNHKKYYIAKPVKLSISNIEIVKSDSLGIIAILKNSFLDYINLFNHKGIIMALLFGDKSYMSTSEKDIFQNTGVAHLVAISGMHISFVYTLFYRYLSCLYSAFLYRKCFVNKYVFKSVVALVITYLYALISGFSIPTQRAFIVLTIFALIELFKRKISSINTFIASLIIVIFYDPLVISEVSFLLSFIASAYLMFLFVNYDERCKLSSYYFGLYSVKNYLSSHHKIFCALVPITIACFSKISLYSVFANIISVPLVSIIILPLLIISIFLFSVDFFIFNHKIYFLYDHLLNFIEFILKKLMQYLSVFSDISNNLYFNYFEVDKFIILTILSIICFLPKGLPKFNNVFILGLLFYISIQSNFSKNKLIIDILDVGQGLSVLINTKNHQLLYDTGPKLLGDYIAHNVILNTVHSYRKNLDYLVISHWDNDHSGNYNFIADNLKPKWFITSDVNKLNSSILYNKVYCNQDFKFYLDNIELEFLQTYDDTYYRKNNSSCVLVISNGAKKIMLTGDIEYKTERNLIKKYGEKLKSDVLVVPHHGSLTSSSYDFINHVKPSYAIISVGKDNIYKLPKSEVIERYYHFGSKVLRTDHLGALRLVISDDEIYIKSIL